MILFNIVEPFEQIDHTLDRKPIEMMKSGQRKRHLKITQFDFIYVYSPEAKADNPQGTFFD